MTEPVRALVNGAKLVGESVLPGVSLLMEGKLVNGAVHTVLGLGAKALLGPAGLIIVAADSFSKSVTDKYLWDHVVDAARPLRKCETAAAEAPADKAETPAEKPAV
ncbi:DUF6072 family protein [Magnetospirillum sp. 15-1]|uniref:DUF6072 family protein n=1 Tax=Magnetospirillum sp. 15-1 TaxID=1979370 RepID=UPI002413B224|nr:DUF6072 family protein [Magnetospirillum sp. 15-1]